MIITILILCILLIGVVFYAYQEHGKAKERIQINEDIKKQNAELEQNYFQLVQQEQNIKKEVEKDLETLKNVKEAASDALNSQQEISQKAFENYCEILSKQYDEKAAEYAALQTSAEGAAKRGYVDQIISAADTRKYVIGAFEMLFSKREDRPAKKHGTV